jgi:hypothetical protein
MAHAGKASALQDHSIGPDYPLTVVGTIDGGGTRYYIANLVENTRDITSYESSYVAHELMRFIRTGAYDPIWRKWVGA